MSSDYPWHTDTRFRPRPRARTALFTMIPVFDVLLLACAFGLFSLAFAKRPGEVVELPRGNAGGGMRSSLHLVARPADKITSDPATVATANMFVFFGDTQYDLRLESEVSAFVAAVADKSAVIGETGILLHIGNAVAHGDTMSLSRMLRAAGVERVCFVIDPENE